MLRFDWYGDAGQAVSSPITGTIVEVKQSKGDSGQIFGGVVKVEDPKTGLTFVFRHVDPADLQVGQTVEAGTAIGGLSAWTGGKPHANVEVWRSKDGGYNTANMLDPFEVFGTL